MPTILKTKGIVLRTFPFKESSLFCSIFTERFGKLKLIAKGARRPKSKLCGTLEPFIHSEVIFYKKESKDTYTLSDAVVIENFPELRSSELRFAACEAICEFVDKTTVIEEPNRALYAEILRLFNKISMAEERIIGFWTILMLYRLLKFAGVEPYLKDCVRCHRPISTEIRLNFSIAAGGLVCEDHFDESVISINIRVKEMIKNAKVGDFSQEIDLATFSLLKNLLESYVIYHLNGITLNTLKFIKN